MFSGEGTVEVAHYWEKMRWVGVWFRFLLADPRISGVHRISRIDFGDLDLLIGIIIYNYNYIWLYQYSPNLPSCLKHRISWEMIEFGTSYWGVDFYVRPFGSIFFFSGYRQFSWVEFALLLLMVQISGVHQLRLIVYQNNLQVFFYIPGGCLGVLPQDFFHQQ